MYVIQVAFNSFIPFAAAFLLLEESLTSKQYRLKRSNGDSENFEPTDLETKDSSSSLQSNDSGIEISRSSKLEKVDSDTELIDITRPEMDDDDLIMVESDMDTDSDLERVNSDTELLIEERKVNHSSNLFRTRLLLKSHSCYAKCLASQCGPQQWYSRVRNSLMDTYGCLIGFVEYLKGCGQCRRKEWTPGEVRGQAVEKLKRLRRSVVNLVCLILDRRVFLSTLLYGSFAFFTIMCQEVQCVYIWVVIVIS